MNLEYVAYFGYAVAAGLVVVAGPDSEIVVASGKVIKSLLMILSRHIGGGGAHEYIPFAETSASTSHVFPCYGPAHSSLVKAALSIPGRKHVFGRDVAVDRTRVTLNAKNTGSFSRHPVHLLSTQRHKADWPR